MEEVNKNRKREDWKCQKSDAKFEPNWHKVPSDIPEGFRNKI